MSEKHRQEQLRRLLRLLDDHVHDDDVALTDRAFVKTVAFRFEREKVKRGKI